MKDLKIKISEVVLDYDLYPRTIVDRQHIAYMSEAEDAGADLPPILVDSKTKKVIDGFHRVTMYRQKYGDNHEIRAQQKTYSNNKEMLLDSIRLNAHHGRNLTTHDRTRCIILAEKLHVDQGILSSAMCITIEKIGELKTQRIGELHITKTTTGNLKKDRKINVNYVALKRTIRHKAGQKLSKKQAEANVKLGGMDQKFYINQLILLIENDLINKGDEIVLLKLSYLKKLLNKIAELRSLCKVG